MQQKPWEMARLRTHNYYSIIVAYSSTSLIASCTATCYDVISGRIIIHLCVMMTGIFLRVGLVYTEMSACYLFFFIIPIEERLIKLL